MSQKTVLLDALKLIRQGVQDAINLIEESYDEEVESDDVNIESDSLENESVFDDDYSNYCPECKMHYEDCRCGPDEYCPDCAEHYDGCECDLFRGPSVSSGWSTESGGWDTEESVWDAEEDVWSTD